MAGGSTSQHDTATRSKRSDRAGEQRREHQPTAEQAEQSHAGNADKAQFPVEP